MKKVLGLQTPATITLLMALAFGKLQGQDYQRKINWQAKPKTFHTIRGETITQPAFSNAAYLEQKDLLPLYQENIPVGTVANVSAQIVNAVYSPAQNVDSRGVKYIQSNIVITARSSMYKKRPRAYVSFIPLRKNPSTGAIEKLESFTLKLTLTPKPQPKSAIVYAANSVLSSGTWYKVSVYNTGIYKIDYNFLKSMGINPSDINVTKLAVFGNGGGMVPDQNSVPRPDDLLENPTQFVDQNGNGKFDQGDYLLFYGQMADGWQYNSSTHFYSHQKNLYTTVNYYFITPDAGTGKRVTAFTTAGTPNITVTDFDDRAYHDSEQVSLLQSGRDWFGDEMTDFNTADNFTYNFPNLVTSVPVRFSSEVANSSPSNNNTYVSINGTQIINHSVAFIDPSYEYPFAYIASDDTADYYSNSSQLNITYTFYDPPGGDPQGIAYSYVHYFDINARRLLILTGDEMAFRNIHSSGAGNISNFILSNANSNTVVWDVTNIGNVLLMPGTLSGSQLSFITPTDTVKEFIAFNSTASFPNPVFVGNVENQNLHAIGQPNYIIVAYDDFVAPSNDLADFHREYDNLSSVVVKLSEVYNEFGSGKPDISAIRDFVRMLYNRAGNDTALMPQYLLLMGHGSFDPLNRTPGAENFLNTYQSYNSYDPTATYTSDDFFVLLDPNDGGDITDASQLMDLGVGRISAESEAEAWGVVNKIKNYKRPSNCSTCVQLNTDNSWRNLLTFVADDGDEDLFLTTTEQLDNAVGAVNPDYNIFKIYMDAYKQVTTPAGTIFPDVNTAILNTINTGTFLMNWVGHGGPSNWAQERVFNLSDIIQLKNQYLPLFITATCDFSAFDYITRTAGEWLIMNPSGGGIASITTVRLVYSDANAALNTAVFNYLFQTSNYIGGYLRLGDIISLTKNSLSTQNVDITNTRKFTLLGDPAMELDYPHNNVVTTTVDNKPITAPHDTLKALTQITIKGQVQDNNGNLLNSFNGTITPTVYDKIDTLSTLGNNSESPPMQFLEYQNVLFKGLASVNNGNFSFTFIVPKDINYRYGPGRISYYADNGNYVDAHGYSTAITIGGSADTAKISKTGPKINIYMNDANFVYGGITNPNPVLLVNLQDPGGINTTGNGVGHDLTAVLDNNVQNKIILNDYYQTALNNFTQGSVKYPLSNLAVGQHTIVVTAFDAYNNSSQGDIEFIVTNSGSLSLDHVYNYPNPFTTHTEFMFEHNSPCDNLDVDIQIYSVSGKLVKKIIEQNVVSTGYRVQGITWNGLDDFGQPIGKGVYVYKLTVHDSNGNTANKFEKLVVLR